MNFSPAHLLQNIKFPGKHRAKYSFGRENVIFWGNVLLLCLLLLLLAWDAYLFYYMVFTPRESVFLPERSVVVKQEELDQLMNIIAERWVKFNAVMQSYPVAADALPTPEN